MTNGFYLLSLMLGLITLSEANAQTWGKCADEGQICLVSGSQTVRYGASGKYFTKVIDRGEINCSVGVFGDPAVGIKKSCEILNPTQPRVSGWFKCASEGGTCSVAKASLVRYGASNYKLGAPAKWFQKEVLKSIACNSNSFGGDPLYGVHKNCEYFVQETVTSNWVKCADENQVCTVSGSKTVRYGASGKYVTKIIDGSIPCNNKSFGSDPIYGVQKTCEYSDGETTIPPVNTNTPVYSGCSIPSGKYNTPIVLDAAKGDTLQKYFDAKKAQPGDHLIVKGNQGSIYLNESSHPVFASNDKFFKIEGQGAVFTKIDIRGVSKLLFTNVKVLDFTGSNTHLIYLAAAKDIIIADSQISGSDDSSRWAVSEWFNAPNGINSDNSKCVSAIRNKLKNLRMGIQAFTRATVSSETSIKVLMLDNELRNVSGDFLRPNGSDITIQGNKAYDTYLSSVIDEDGDGAIDDLNHDDFIQGFAPVGVHYNNVKLIDNYFQETTNVNRKWKAESQGIGFFDGTFTNFIFKGNVVLGSAFHGIAIGGGINGIIENNTVLSIRPKKEYPFWISVGITKQKEVSVNVIVRNNVTNKIQLDSRNTGATYINNYEVPMQTASDYFMNFNIETSTFDVRPKTSSPFYGKGVGAKN